MPDLSRITDIEDLRLIAKRRVPRMFYDYADSGSWTESTYRANEADFHKILLRQRVACNMENRSTRTQMIGQEVAMPVAIAPVGLTGMQHADGEIKAARAAQKFGIPFILSTMSICSIEDRVNGMPNFSAARAAWISPSACCMPVRPTGAMHTGIETGRPTIWVAVLRFSMFTATRWRSLMDWKSLLLAR